MSSKPARFNPKFLPPTSPEPHAALYTHCCVAILASDQAEVEVVYSDLKVFKSSSDALVSWFRLSGKTDTFAIGRQLLRYKFSSFNAPKFQIIETWGYEFNPIQIPYVCGSLRSNSHGRDVVR